MGKAISDGEWVEREVIEVDMGETVHSENGKILNVSDVASCFVVAMNSIDNDRGTMYHGAIAYDWIDDFFSEANEMYDTDRTEVFVRGGNWIEEENVGKDMARIKEYLLNEWDGNLVYIDFSNNGQNIRASLDTREDTFVSETLKGCYHETV